LSGGRLGNVLDKKSDKADRRCSEHVSHDEISQMNDNELLFSRCADISGERMEGFTEIRLKGLSATLRLIRCSGDKKKQTAALDGFSVGIDLKLF